MVYLNRRTAGIPVFQSGDRGMAPKKILSGISNTADPDLRSRVGFLLRNAHQVAVAIFVEEVGHLSLTPPQHNVVSAINQHPGCSQAELSRAVGYDRATVGAVLIGLESRNLIRRTDSPHDRRLKTLSTTRQGKQLLRAAAPATDRIDRRVMEVLSPEDRVIFVRLLTQIAFSRRLDS
jgi:MarR family transcriptional regulator, lower aerobic nicotinate degradation pathway regulator